MNPELRQQIEARAEGIKCPPGWNNERLGRLNRAASRMRKETEDAGVKSELLDYENTLVKEDNLHA